MLRKLTLCATLLLAVTTYWLRVTPVSRASGESAERSNIDGLIEDLLTTENWGDVIDSLEKEGAPAAGRLADTYIERPQLSAEAKGRIISTLAYIGGEAAFSGFLRVMREAPIDAEELHHVGSRLVHMNKAQVRITCIIEELTRQEDSPRLRAYLIEALASTGDPSVVKVIRPYLKDPSAEIRLSAARMLLGFGDRSGADIIFDAIRRDYYRDSLMKAEALWALREGFQMTDFPQDEYVRRMKELLRHHAPLHVFALLAISKMAGDSHVPEELGRAAARLLARGEHELPRVRREAVEVVARSSLPEKNEILWKAANEDADVDVRCAACFWLAREGDEEASEILIELSRGRNFVAEAKAEAAEWYTKVTAARRLLQLGDKRGFDAYGDLLRQQLKEGAQGARDAAFTLAGVQQYSPTSFDKPDEWLQWYSAHKDELVWSPKQQRFKLSEETQEAGPAESKN